MRAGASISRALTRRAQQHLGRAIDVGGGRGGARRVRGDGRQGQVRPLLPSLSHGMSIATGTRAAAAELREGFVNDAGRVGHLH